MSLFSEKMQFDVQLDQKILVGLYLTVVQSIIQNWEGHVFGLIRMSCQIDFKRYIRLQFVWIIIDNYTMCFGKSMENWVI